MKWILYQSLSEFTPSHLYEAIKLRQDIFIIEQNCIYDDMDGLDYESRHLLMFSDDNILIGYLRIVPPGTKFDELSLGRIAIRENFRGKGLGKKLIEIGLNIAKEKGEASVRIEAQAYLEKFYTSMGFKKVSKVYSVDDIPHMQMIVKA